MPELGALPWRGLTSGTARGYACQSVGGSPMEVCAGPGRLHCRSRQIARWAATGTATAWLWRGRARTDERTSHVLRSFLRSPCMRPDNRRPGRYARCSTTPRVARALRGSLTTRSHPAPLLILSSTRASSQPRHILLQLSSQRSQWLARCLFLVPRWSAALPLSLRGPFYIRVLPFTNPGDCPPIVAWKHPLVLYWLFIGDTGSVAGETANLGPDGRRGDAWTRTFWWQARENGEGGGEKGREEENERTREPDSPSPQDRSHAVASAPNDSTIRRPPTADRTTLARSWLTHELMTHSLARSHHPAPGL